MKRVVEYLLMLLAAAMAIRFAALLIEPALPLIAGLVVSVGLIAWLLGKHNSGGYR